MANASNLDLLTKNWDDWVEAMNRPEYWIEKGIDRKKVEATFEEISKRAEEQVREMNKGKKE